LVATEVAIVGLIADAKRLAWWRRHRAVVRYITLPLAVPLVLAAALLINVLAVSEFRVPGLLRVRVCTTEVSTAFAARDDVSRAIGCRVLLRERDVHGR
jgi:ABC-type Fe3+ transport system permease subunit